jgi:hypothetical protein
MVAVLLGALGCYRTTYHHLEPPSALSSSRPPQLVRDDSGWQHFFVYGWAPSERVIDASARCGGADQVQEIQTRQTFVQGLIATFAGYYINIYSPYTGQVICAGNLRR